MKWRPKGGKPLTFGCNAMLGRNFYSSKGALKVSTQRRRYSFRHDEGLQRIDKQVVILFVFVTVNEACPVHPRESVGRLKRYALSGE